jgi:hypothetical protein
VGRPGWLADVFAAFMIAVAAYCVGRLAVAGRWRRPTELDADGVHVLMGVAMAGMLAAGLTSLPAGVWELAFGAAAAWFAWQAIRVRLGSPVGPWICRHPGPHLVESLAMLYALLAVRAAGHGGTASGMAMGASAGGVRFPALAGVIAVFMAGYVVWITDLLTSPAAAAAVLAGGGKPAGPGAVSLSDDKAAPQAGAPDAEDTAGCRPALAPRLATCYKIVMGVTMGYMFILLL